MFWEEEMRNNSVLFVYFLFRFRKHRISLWNSGAFGFWILLMLAGILLGKICQSPWHWAPILFLIFKPHVWLQVDRSWRWFFLCFSSLYHWVVWSPRGAQPWATEPADYVSGLANGRLEMGENKGRQWWISSLTQREWLMTFHQLWWLEFPLISGIS